MSEDQFSEGYNNEGEDSKDVEGTEDVEYAEEEVSQRPPQRTSPKTQRPPQKAPQRTVGTQKPAPPVKRIPPPVKPANPYKEGTEKFLVAQKLLAGDTDRGRVSREIGVSLHTLYTVASDLRAHGYTIIEDVKSAKSGAAAAGAAARYSPAPQPTPRGDVSRTSTGDGTQESPSAEDVQNEVGYFPGDVPEDHIPLREI